MSILSKQRMRSLTSQRCCPAEQSSKVDSRSAPADNDILLESLPLTPMGDLASPASRLARSLAQVFDSLSLRDAPYIYLPSFVGHDQAVDAAARAAVSAHHHWARDSAASAEQLAFDNLRAVKTLRERLNTDDTSLVSVSLLAFSNRLLDADPWRLEDDPHVSGIRAIMEARPPATKHSLVARVITTTYLTSDHTFWATCIRGESAAWDTERWLRLNDGVSTQAQTCSLRHTIYKLFFRLPGLISRTRACSDERSRDSYKDIRPAIILADEILDLQEWKAESRLLHCVAVEPSADPSKRAVMPYSYHFDAPEFMWNTLVYWKLRLLAVRVRLRQDHLRKAADLEGNVPSLSTFEATALSAEQSRLVANILMTCPGSLRGVLEPKGWMLALAAVWGALSDLGTFRGKPANVVQAWVLRRFQELIVDGAFEGNATLLQVTAELFVGGPLGLVPFCDHPKVELTTRRMNVWKPSDP